MFFFRMLKISRKFCAALLAGSFFSTNQWHFENKCTKDLIQSVRTTNTNHVFEIDIESSDFNWEHYVECFILGVRQYILKDKLDTLPQARTKLIRSVKNMSHVINDDNDKNNSL